MPPLAVIEVKGGKSNSSNLPIAPCIVPLEIIFPDDVIPVACKCLHFLEVDPKSNVL
mgnify:CR=1 FL=1